MGWYVKVGMQTNQIGNEKDDRMGRREEVKNDRRGVGSRSGAKVRGELEITRGGGVGCLPLRLTGSLALVIVWWTQQSDRIR